MTSNNLLRVTAGLKRSAALCFVAAATLGISSCIDDKYDLSDIDTNVRLKVENLTLPINIDEIKLKSIIDEPAKDDILQIVDDEYTLVRKGDFASSDLKVNPITISAPHVNPAVATFKPSLPAGAPRREIPDEVAFSISDNISAAINYFNNDVPTEIVSVAKLGIDWTVSFTVRIEAVGNSTSKFFLREFYFQLPKNLVATSTLGDYDSATGLLYFPYLEVNNNVFSFNLHVTGIVAEAPQVVLDTTGSHHSLALNTEVGIDGGQIGLKLADVSLTGIPTELKVTTNLWLSNIDVKTFSGKIKYDVDAFNIAPVNLNDLPDVLSQPGTDVSLTNPQIYIRIENPFSMYSLKANTAFKLIANRPGESPVVSSINNGTFDITGAAVSSYCLAPTRPDHYYVDPDPDEAAIYNFSNAIDVPFTALSTALAGNGLPKTIDIKLDPTTVPAQEVNDFVLGKYNAVKGNYLFFSPLSMGKDSKIIYSSTENGWADEDLNKLTITKLNVSMEVDNNLPFDIELTGTPLNVDGPIPGTSITPVRIHGGETEPVTIEVVGTITRLDGIEFSASAVSDKNAAALKPSQYINLKNIRVTVSGHYDDEL